MMASLFLMTTGPAKAAQQQKQGAPLILMDIDAEDGGPKSSTTSLEVLAASMGIGYAFQELKWLAIALAE
jgi:hypothetical protein